MARTIDVARKLDLTAIALGCLTRKELCAAFFEVNPNTVLTLQNCYNWLGGRSTPRSFSLYEDWAQVLGLDEGPHFIMTSTLAAFTQRLATKMDLPEALLAYPTDSLSSSAVAEPRGNPAPSWRTNALLKGSYLMLSLAWAPTARGRLLGGALLLGTRDDGALRADYLETILGQRVRFEGRGVEHGRTAQLTLTCTANAETFFMALHLPILPGNLGAGIFAGNTVYDADSAPSACPVLLVRNHALTQEELETRTDYLDADAEALAGLLEDLGYGRDCAYAAENALLLLLTTTSDIPLIKVQREALTRAATLVDERRMQTE
ncbi:MAG TPA: hypothetical protein VLQ65_02305 [Saliniramus sp.]|nr:hypothetical protein [Saliniramus sp.]